MKENRCIIMEIKVMGKLLVNLVIYQLRLGTIMKNILGVQRFIQKDRKIWYRVILKENIWILIKIFKF